MKKKEPWRILLALVSLAYIIFLWAYKGMDTAASLPEEAVLPLMVTTAAVSLGKAALLAGVLLLIRWIVRWLQSK